jgi:hypothetical protein
MYHQGQNESFSNNIDPQTFTYGKNNTTNDNIGIFLKNRENQKHLEYYSLNIMPYNSFSNNPYQSVNQFPNQMSQNLEQRQNTYNNNEINYETTTENNIINETHYFENTIGNNNNINNEEKKEEKKGEDEEEDDIIDPEHLAFERRKDEMKKGQEEQENEGEELSSYSDESNNEKDFSNYLLAQYEKVKRVKNKWKVSLKGCIVQKDKKEYVCGKIHGELSREW